ncbi:MAG TPA: competence/damage-inducible protein A [Acidimicrobiales bacterium]|nr:competence/damage-inducible protein A [Acidimicrobiales bacterium]
MRCEVVTVGTELLLGHVVDSNGAWIGEALAASGIDSHYRTAVGDNRARIASAVRTALGRSDAVLVCGGLGPTPDDVTREALADVMGVALVRDPDLLERITSLFAARGRPMPESNVRQADVPVGASPIPQTVGTAPGLVCPVGARVVYAVPGVPDEMREMVERAVLPDLRARSGETSSILSRVLRVWGLPEASVAEVLAPRLAALDAAGSNPTLAFLASGIEGIKVRVTAKAGTEEAARRMVDAELEEARRLLGSHVFGVDEESMEAVVGELLEEGGLWLGLAESMTGGLAASRVVSVEGCSGWFSGAIVSYDSQIKFDLLGVPVGPVVSEEAAAAMAEGARKLLEADVGLSVTGVAGPEPQDGVEPGTAFVGLSLDGDTEVTRLTLPGNRERVRQLAVISMLDLLRRRLLERSARHP